LSWPGQGKMKIPVWLSTFAIVSTVYVLSAFPSLTGGDSGELLAESCTHPTIGTAHPPGYPTFLQLASLVRKLPLPFLARPLLSSDYKKIEYDVGNPLTVAWRVNVMCAVLGAICAACIASTTFSMLSLLSLHKFKDAVSVIAGLAFAFSPLVWEYSVTAEVFALNNAILAAQLMFTVRILALRNSVESSDHRFESIYLALGALLSGLAMSNQHASALQLVVVIPFAFFATIKRFTPFRFVVVVISFLAGISPYYSLYLAAKEPKLGSWGDLRSLEGFVKHVLRAEYGTFQLGLKTGAETAVQRMTSYVNYTSSQYYHAVFPLVAIALMTCLDEKILLGVTAAVPAGGNNAEVTTVTTSSAGVGKTSAGTAKNAKMEASETKADTGLRQRKQKGGQASSSSVSADASKDTVTAESSADADKSATDDAKKPNKPAKPVSDKKSQSPGEVNYRAAQLPLACILAVWVVYIGIWHTVFSNLPLHAPMPFAVHSRFWMQPNIPLSILAGVGLGFPLNKIGSLFTDPWSNQLSDFNTANPDERPGVFKCLLSIMMVSAYAFFVLRDRFAANDRSRDGTIMHVYGNNTLNILPKHSIYVAHTDLDWNAIRYFQLCEDFRTDVTAISIQLMPFPWFKHTQAPLYVAKYGSDPITFPSTEFDYVSTDRLSEGNARLIGDFIGANTHVDNRDLMSMKENELAFLKLDVAASNEHLFGPGIFIDMQAINEVDIGGDGLSRWRGDNGAYTLIPWGNSYRVLNKLESLDDIREYHQVSLMQLKNFAKGFPANLHTNDAFYAKYPAGSWEHAAASVYHDAHYQFGLHLLTYCIEVLKTVDLVKMTVVIDRLHIAVTLLHAAMEAGNRYGAISSPLMNVRKNAALAYMRYQGVLNVAVLYKHDVEKHFYKSHLNQVRLSLVLGK
jgi:hypothetical protein